MANSSSTRKGLSIGTVWISTSCNDRDLHDLVRNVNLHLACWERRYWSCMLYRKRDFFLSAVKIKRAMNAQILQQKDNIDSAGYIYETVSLSWNARYRSSQADMARCYFLFESLSGNFFLKRSYKLFSAWWQTTKLWRRITCPNWHKRRKSIFCPGEKSWLRNIGLLTELCSHFSRAEVTTASWHKYHLSLLHYDIKHSTHLLLLY